MDTFLKKKVAGLPGWAWVVMLGGAVGVGLYLRHRAKVKEEESPGEVTAPAEGTLSQYEGTNAAGGLAAAGLVGPAGSQITPVNTPYIPEAFTDIMNSQAALIASLASPTGARPGETAPGDEGPEPGVTGGGPPNRKPSNDIRKRERERGEKSLLHKQSDKRTKRELAREEARVKRLRKQGRRKPRGKKSRSKVSGNRRAR